MEPYKAEDVIPIVAKMNGEIKTCNNCLHQGAKRGRRCYDCTSEGDDLPKWERLSRDACLKMTGGEATTIKKEVGSTVSHMEGAERPTNDGPLKTPDYLAGYVDGYQACHDYVNGKLDKMAEVLK